MTLLNALLIVLSCYLTLALMTRATSPQFTQTIHWNEDKLVDNRTVINSDTLLIIDPGVTVTLRNYSTIHILGALKAVGTAQKRIVLQSDDGLISMYDDMIAFSSTADLDQSELSFVDLVNFNSVGIDETLQKKDATLNVKNIKWERGSGFSVDTASLNIENSQFVNVDRAISFSGKKLSVKNSKFFFDARQTKVPSLTKMLSLGCSSPAAFYSANGDEYDIVIEGNMFSNVTGGFISSHNCMSVSIKNNTFSECSGICPSCLGQCIAMSGDLQSISVVPKVHIVGNTFEQYRFHAIELPHGRIEQNKFSNSDQQSIRVNDPILENSELVVLKNIFSRVSATTLNLMYPLLILSPTFRYQRPVTFSGNVVAQCELKMSASMALLNIWAPLGCTSTGAMVTIEGNEFSSNVGQVVNMQFDVNLPSTINMHRNTFFNNTGQAQLVQYYASFKSVMVTAQFDMTQNSFASNTQLYLLSVTDSKSGEQPSVVTNATLNFWQSPTKVKDRIFDSFGGAQVTYIPWLKTSNFGDLSKKNLGYPESAAPGWTSLEIGLLVFGGICVVILLVGGLVGGLFFMKKKQQESRDENQRLWQ